MPAAIRRMQHERIRQNPAFLSVDERRAFEIVEESRLGLPCSSPILGMQNRSVIAHHPSGFFIHKKQASQMERDITLLLCPCLPAISGMQYNPVSAYPSAMVSIDKLQVCETWTGR